MAQVLLPRKARSMRCLVYASPDGVCLFALRSLLLASLRWLPVCVRFLLYVR